MCCISTDPAQTRNVPPRKSITRAWAEDELRGALKAEAAKPFLSRAASAALLSLVQQQAQNTPQCECIPCVATEHELRGELKAAARRLGEASKYRSAGTIEFLVDQDTARFYFLEVNTRLQARLCTPWPAFRAQSRLAVAAAWPWQAWKLGMDAPRTAAMLPQDL